jgi:hypothetical protein
VAFSSLEAFLNIFELFETLFAWRLYRSSNNSEHQDYTHGGVMPPLPVTPHASVMLNFVAVEWHRMKIAALAISLILQSGFGTYWSSFHSMATPQDSVFRPNQTEIVVAIRRQNRSMAPVLTEGQRGALC